MPFVERLRARHPGRIVPWFDPADGGAEARVLYLLEKPSRGSAVLTDGPAFISMDNPTSGARRMKALMAEAGVDRRRVLIWNAVPWWNGRVPVTAAELADGTEALGELLALLPDLRSVCLVGRKAEAVWARAQAAGPGIAVPVFVSAHYSANVRAAFPDRWAAIPGIWAEAHRAALGA